MKRGRPPKSEASKKADSRLAARKKGEKGTKKAKRGAKDPNKPKRPPSAFFVFMEEFRKQFKEKNPNNKSVAAVGKAGGEKWKSMSEAEKAPYVAKAEKRKIEYTKNLAAYNRKQAGGSSGGRGKEEEDESDKSKSEVNDGEDDEEEESGEEEGEEEED